MENKDERTFEQIWHKLNGLATGMILSDENPGLGYGVQNELKALWEAYERERTTPQTIPHAVSCWEVTTTETGAVTYDYDQKVVNFEIELTKKDRKLLKKLLRALESQPDDDGEENEMIAEARAILEGVRANSLSYSSPRHA